jgi:hypothetical protein
MSRQSFPQSIRQYIRLQKADIRRQILDTEEQERRIAKLYEDMIHTKPQEPVSSKKEE